MEADDEDTSLVPVPQADVAEIHDVPKKRTTIAGFQAPLPPTDGGPDSLSGGPQTIVD